MKFKTLISAALVIVGLSAIAETAIDRPAPWFSEAVQSGLAGWSGEQEDIYEYVAAGAETPAYVDIDADQAVFSPSTNSVTDKVRETLRFCVAPVDSLDDLDALVESEAQVSFCVSNDTYYAAVKDGDTPAWIPLAGATATKGEWVTIAFEFNYADSEAPTVSFYLVDGGNETVLYSAVDTSVTVFTPLTVKTCITSTSFSGCGKISSLSGIQQGYFKVGDDHYATFMEAVTAAGGTNTITLLKDAMVDENVTASVNLNGHQILASVVLPGVAVSGSGTVAITADIETTRLTGEDVTILASNADGATVTLNGSTTTKLVFAGYVAKISTTGYSSLSAALDAATAGVTVTLLAASAEAVTIPTNVTVDAGTNAITGSIAGAGKLSIGAKPDTALVFGEWTGTVAINYNATGRFVFNEFGITGSKVEIAAACSALPSTAWSDGTAPSINPEIVLSADWTVSDGWAGTSTPTTFSALSGSGTLTVDGSSSGTDKIYYAITKLNGFTGTLAGKRGQFTIGDIVVAEPAYGTALVKVTVGSNGYTPDITSATLNSASAVLCLDTVNSQYGVYMTAANVVADDDTTIGYATVANALDAADAANAPTVAVVNTSAAQVVKANWTYADGTYTSTRVVATLDAVNYTSLTKALAAAKDGDTVELVAASAEAVTIPAGVTVHVVDDIVFSGVLSGAGSIKYTKVPASFNKSDLLGSDWTGTYVIDYDYTSTSTATINFNAYGTESSSVEIAAGRSFKGWPNLNAGNVTTTLKVSGYAELNNGTTQSRIEFSKVTGSGVIAFTSDKNYTIVALEDWNGVITNSANRAWVTNIVSGVGTVIYAAAPGAAPVVGDGFTGDVHLNFNWHNYPIQQYGGANSRIILGDMSGDNTYLPDINISSTVVVEGDVVINNGNPLATASVAWDNARVIQMPELKVDGTLKLEKKTVSGSGAKTWNDGYYAHYYAGVLDASGVGSIEVGNQFALRVDAVDFAEAPSGGNALVHMSLTQNGDKTNIGLLYGPNGVAGESIPATVNGTDVGKSLVYATLNEQSGLYLAVAQVNGVKYATLAEAVDAADAASLDEIVKLADTSEEVPSGWKLSAVGTTWVRKVNAAQIGDTTYETLALAVNAATEGQTIKMLVGDQSMPRTVEVAITLDLNSFIVYSNGSQDGPMLQTNVTVVNTAESKGKLWFSTGFGSESGATYKLAKTEDLTLITVPSNERADGSTITLVDGYAVLTNPTTGYDDGNGGTFTIASETEAQLKAAIGGAALSGLVTGKSFSYAQAYALGLWDGTADGVANIADLEASISIVDGKAKVSLATTPATGFTVTCKVFEKASLAADWPSSATYAYILGSETEITPGSAGFYKVQIVIGNAD